METIFCIYKKFPVKTMLSFFRHTFSVTSTQQIVCHGQVSSLKVLDWLQRLRAYVKSCFVLFCFNFLTRFHGIAILKFFIKTFFFKVKELNLFQSSKILSMENMPLKLLSFLYTYLLLNKHTKKAYQ